MGRARPVLQGSGRLIVLNCLDADLIRKSCSGPVNAGVLGLRAEDAEDNLDPRADDRQRNARDPRPAPMRPSL